MSLIQCVFYVFMGDVKSNGFPTDKDILKKKHCVETRKK